MILICAAVSSLSGVTRILRFSLAVRVLRVIRIVTIRIFCIRVLRIRVFRIRILRVRIFCVRILRLSLYLLKSVISGLERCHSLIHFRLVVHGQALVQKDGFRRRECRAECNH